MSIDKVIIGAGFSGLLHGLSSIQAGQQVLLLEKNQTPGGLIQSEEIDSVKFDSGAEAFSNVTPEFENWLSDLGLDALVVKPNTKYTLGYWVDAYFRDNNRSFDIRPNNERIKTKI